jgi:hypothetical protein
LKITEVNINMPLSSRALRVVLSAATLGGIGLFSSLGAVAVSAAEPSSTSSAVVGHIYVDDNTRTANTIAAFNRHADGSLSPTPGSPFVTGGVGTGSGLASQGAVQLTSDGRFLVAVDAGSNQISVLRVQNDGSLKLLPGGVVSSGGALPVSVALHGNLVYVANASPVAPNYTGFVLSPSGKLRPLAGSKVALPDGSQPGDITFNSTGTNLIGARVATSAIDTFAVAADGRLVAAADSPVGAQATGPFGSEFSPTDPSQLFVSNAHAGPGGGSVSSFSAAADGTLSPITPAPVANGQSGTCWVEISHDGKFLFAVNTGTGTISSYSIAATGALTLIGNTPVAAQAGVGAVDARLSPEGSTLFIDESRIGSVAAFAVSGGSLTQLPSSPTALPAGATAAGIAVS